MEHKSIGKTQLWNQSKNMLFSPSTDIVANTIVGVVFIPYLTPLLAFGLNVIKIQMYVHLLSRILMQKITV